MTSDTPIDLRPYGWAPGDYMFKCRACGGRGFGDKRCRNCYECAVIERARIADMLKVEIPRPITRLKFSHFEERGGGTLEIYEDAEKKLYAVERPPCRVSPASGNPNNLRSPPYMLGGGNGAR